MFDPVLRIGDDWVRPRLRATRHFYVDFILIAAFLAGRIASLRTENGVERRWIGLRAFLVLLAPVNCRCNVRIEPQSQSC